MTDEEANAYDRYVIACEALFETLMATGRQQLVIDATTRLQQLNAGSPRAELFEPAFVATVIKVLLADITREGFEEVVRQNGVTPAEQSDAAFQEIIFSLTKMVADNEDLFRKVHDSLSRPITFAEVLQDFSDENVAAYEAAEPAYDALLHKLLATGRQQILVDLAAKLRQRFSDDSGMSNMYFDPAIVARILTVLLEDATPEEHQQALYDAGVTPFEESEPVLTELIMRLTMMVNNSAELSARVHTDIYYPPKPR